MKEGWMSTTAQSMLKNTETDYTWLRVTRYTRNLKIAAFATECPETITAMMPPIPNQR
jgi:hypothetical protein